MHRLCSLSAALNAATDGAYNALKSWVLAMPTGIEGRRQMPLFDLSDEEFNAISDFLLWTNSIRTQDWPPDDAG